MTKYSGFHRALEIDHRSHRKVWQVHLCSEIDLTWVEDLRHQFAAKGQPAPTYTAFLIKAIALAIARLQPEYPQLNSFIQRFLGWRKLHVFSGISGGCSTALATEDAVVVGVVLEPQTKSLGAISGELKEFSRPDSAAVRETLRYYRWPGWLQRLAHGASQWMPAVRYERRGTFCLNPVGKFGCDIHLSLPQTSTLQFGMGAVRERVVARNGEATVAKTVYLTVSFDRLILNGRPVARLLSTIAEVLQDPRAINS